MDPSSLLAQLRDVHAPDKIGAWPPSFSLVLLVLLACISIAAIVWFTYSRYQKNAWRRTALKEFMLLQKKYKETTSSYTLTEISSLLKRCYASLNNDTRMLAMTGDKWKNVLQGSNSPLKEAEINLLCFGHYQAKFDPLDNYALIRIRKWIKTLKEDIKPTNQDNKLETKAS